MMRALGLCIMLLATSSAAESRNPYLLQAKVFFQGLDFEKCLKRLEQAGKWQNTTEQLADVELYVGLCELALGNEKDAMDHFEVACSIDENLSLPPLQGPKVTAVFEKARAKAKVLSTKPALPSPTSDSPALTKLTPDNPSRFIETTAPTERHLVVPIVIGATAIAAAGVATYFGLQAKSLELQANAARYESDAVSMGREARTNALAANVAFGIAGAATVTAIVTYLLIN